MALPVVLVDSATGSDTQASGAGPATALFGTADAVSAADGLSVIVTALLDISGVATDGSAVLYFADATAGNRNFVKITGSSGSGGATPTFTVANALGFTLTKNWAVGGKRVSIGSTTSAKLFSNNATSGDWMPGWIVRMVSGHAETLAAELITRRAGDTTTGPMTLEGISGAATRPVLTWSNNGRGLSIAANGHIVQGFDVANSNATHTASEAICPGANGVVADCWVRDIRIKDQTNMPFYGISIYNGSTVFIQDCEIAYCRSNGINDTASAVIYAFNNVIHHNTGDGIKSITNTSVPNQIVGNIFAFNTGKGVNDTRTSGVGATYNSWVNGNIFHGNGSDGILYVGRIGTVINNVFSFNGGYGVNFSGLTDAYLKFEPTILAGNAFYTNTSGAFNPLTLTVFENSTTASDPSGGLGSATKDWLGVTGGLSFPLAAALKALGYPVAGARYVGNYSTTYSYVDPGMQRQEAGGSAGNWLISGGLVQ